MSQEKETKTFKRAGVTKIPIAELIRTTHALPKGSEQYEAQTYLSPAGRTIAKVMICGTAIEKEDVGKDSSLWRLRVADPSGTVQVYAGIYQTEAAAVIAQLDVPCFVSVVGKLNIYEPEDGSHIVSIRPDSVTVIDGKTRDDFILDAALSLIRSVRKMDDETMKKVVGIYGEKDDKETYIFVARQAIESLGLDLNVYNQGRSYNVHIGDMRNDDKAGEARTKQDKQESKQSQKAPDSVPPKLDSKLEPAEASPSSSSAYPGKSEGKADKKKEPMQDSKGKTSKSIESSIKTVQEVILDILTEKGTVKYEDLPELLKARGVNPLMMDWTSAVKRLMNEGCCCEPKIGVLRVT